MQPELTGQCEAGLQCVLAPSVFPPLLLQWLLLLKLPWEKFQVDFHTPNKQAPAFSRPSGLCPPQPKNSLQEQHPPLPSPLLTSQPRCNHTAQQPNAAAGSSHFLLPAPRNPALISFFPVVHLSRNLFHKEKSGCCWKHVAALGGSSPS